jgi:hypothetical protein
MRLVSSSSFTDCEKNCFSRSLNESTEPDVNPQTTSEMDPHKVVGKALHMISPGAP